MLRLQETLQGAIFEIFHSSTIAQFYQVSTQIRRHPRVSSVRGFTFKSSFANRRTWFHVSAVFSL
jgi:hypothetical protein